MAQIGTQDTDLQISHFLNQGILQYLRKIDVHGYCGFIKPFRDGKCFLYSFGIVLTLLYGAITFSMEELKEMEADDWKPTQKIKDFMGAVAK